MFNREIDFENALVDLLISEKGWSEVIMSPTEQDLIKNWANILKTPLRLNGFINGKSASITRDNPDDVLHFGKEFFLQG